MPTWDSDQYRRFERERTQPARDLCLRIELSRPTRVIDLGCGPGNSTAVVAQRWTDGNITGLDSSQAMLDTARREYPKLQWLRGDIGTWSPDASYDLVFSNAALQWVPDHGSLLSRLIAHVNPGGALAFQVPADPAATPHRLIRELAGSPPWREKFRVRPREWHVETTGFYYDVLSRQAARVDLWSTEYIHVLSDAQGIVEWYRGTGLRPWLDALTDEDDRQRFLRDYGGLISTAYPFQHDGRVLFPFKRLFAIAYR